MKNFHTRETTRISTLSRKKTTVLALHRLLLVLPGLMFCGVSLADDYLDRQDVKVFVQKMVTEQGMERTWLEGLFRDARHQEKVLKLIQRPSEKKPWHEYRKIFLTRERECQGLRYWQQHAKLLNHIEGEYGVPSSVVVAIAGIETNYGHNMGGFPVFDTLVTLSFDYPRRSTFFRGELKALLTLVKNGELDLSMLAGSYAGAMGIGQFIPSSFQSYAVDFDEDGKRDLFESKPDALASIALYLKMNGWKSGSPIAWPLKTKQPAKLDKRWLDRKKPPWLDQRDLTKNGVSVENADLNQKQFSLLALDVGNQHPEYWLAFQNFHTIKSYNPSSLYAMAVYQLSQMLGARWAEQDSCRHG